MEYGFRHDWNDVLLWFNHDGSILGSRWRNDGDAAGSRAVGDGAAAQEADGLITATVVFSAICSGQGAVSLPFLFLGPVSSLPETHGVVFEKTRRNF